MSDKKKIRIRASVYLRQKWSMPIEEMMDSWVIWGLRRNPTGDPMLKMDPMGYSLIINDRGGQEKKIRKPFFKYGFIENLVFDWVQFSNVWSI